MSTKVIVACAAGFVLVVLLVTIAAVVASTRSAPPVAVSDHPTTSASSSAVPTATASSPQRVSVSVAAFREGTTLDECNDVTITPPPEGLAPDWKSRFLSRGKGKSTKELTVLAKTCPEQFADRIVLATCSIGSTPYGDAGATITAVAHYYDVATVVSSDRYMKECLQSGGNWAPIARDSDAFREAQHAATRRRMEQIVDNANKLQGGQ